MRFLCIVLFCYPLGVIQAQSFYKMYDFTPRVSHSAYQIDKVHSNKYVVSYFSTCGDPEAKCCGLFTIDLQGNLINKIRLQNFSNSTNALLVDGKDIYYAGEPDSLKDTIDQIFLHKFDAELKLLSTKIYKDKKYFFLRNFQAELEKFYDWKVIAGGGIVTNESKNDTLIGFLYFINKDMEIDTSLYFNFNSPNNQIWSMYVDAANLLTIHFYTNGHPEQIIRIIKLDKNLQKVFEWQTTQSLNNNRPRGCALKDGRVIIARSDFSSLSLAPELIAINHDTSISWNYIWPRVKANHRRVTSLVQLKNGDIIGTGGLKDSINTKWLPFLFRMTSEGVMLWEKAFYHIGGKEPGSYGDFGDVIELDNGDLMAVGFINQRITIGQNAFDDPDIFIVRLSEDGCLYSECNYVTAVKNIVVDVEDIVQAKAIAIYPNPATNELNIDLDTKSSNEYTYVLYNLLGLQVMQGGLTHGSNKIDVSAVGTGFYVIKIYGNDAVLYTKKVLITK
jgi:hypothetical protein